MIDRIRMALLVLAMMLPPGRAQAGEQAPRPIFELPFDGSPDAVTASANPHPLKAEALRYADGVKGQAVLISRDSFLEYATEGNLHQERGTITLWFKPNWRAAEQSSDSGAGWHCLFSEPFPKSEPGKDSRHGSGALWLWFWGATFRGDISDIHDQYLTAGSQGLNSNTWAHIAFTWDVDKGSHLYRNGVSVGMASDGTSPLNVGKGAADFSAHAVPALPGRRQLPVRQAGDVLGDRHQVGGEDDAAGVAGPPLDV